MSSGSPSKLQYFDWNLLLFLPLRKLYTPPSLYIKKIRFICSHLKGEIFKKLNKDKSFKLLLWRIFSLNCKICCQEYCCVPFPLPELMNMSEDNWFLKGKKVLETRSTANRGRSFR